MVDYKKLVKNMITFKEPKPREEFILKETKDEYGKDTAQDNSSRKEEGKKVKSEDEKIRKSKENNDKGSKKEKESESKPSEISKILSENMEYIKKVYRVPTNGDLAIREFDIVVRDKVIPAFLIFFDGMCDRKIINDNILQPLMLLSNLEVSNDMESVEKYIKNHILPHNQLKEAKSYQDIIDEVNFGGCGIFVEGIDIAFTADVKGWEHRTVGRPNTELVLRGPQEGFNEILRVNTALIRKILKDEDLIVENVKVGRRSKTPISLMYIKDIANDSLVDEVRRRLESIKVDHIIDSGELEQLLEDNTFVPAPQILATERPDRIASMLSEGKVAVAMHGSPFVLSMPATLPAMIHTSEDSYIRFPYANLIRIIRFIGILFSLLLPGIYVAVTNFHQEMIPTDLLFAIASTREQVPFPSVVEILIMEFAFELIREAGIRIPGPIGPTLGIIGALILGQAAVAANIVSPILIIIVAVTGIGSFSVPNFSLGYAFRLLRFGYILLGAMAGFLGITTGIFIQGIWLVSAKSFGVPFLVPFAPKTAGAYGDVIQRAPLWKQERRPDFLNTKNETRQPKISRGWLNSKKGDNGKDEE